MPGPARQRRATAASSSSASPSSAPCTRARPRTAVGFVPSASAATTTSTHEPVKGETATAGAPNCTLPSGRQSGGAAESRRIIARSSRRARSQGPLSPGRKQRNARGEEPHPPRGRHHDTGVTPHRPDHTTSRSPPKGSHRPLISRRRCVIVAVARPIRSDRASRHPSRHPGLRHPARLSRTTVAPPAVGLLGQQLREGVVHRIRRCRFFPREAAVSRAISSAAGSSMSSDDGMRSG